MGSVFNEVEPSEGIKIGEGGKYKYGNMNLSKKNLGQMSLDEYKQQKEFAVVQNELTESSRSGNFKR